MMIAKQRKLTLIVGILLAIILIIQAAMLSSSAATAELKSGTQNPGNKFSDLEVVNNTFHGLVAGVHLLKSKR